ncbi:Protein FAR1-RELATED SEQUENCE [Arachis hypogaea]|nr:Protein FAR1-RELATED SEQUENCE [Arachis hypogaea]
MGGKSPKAVITDRDLTMRDAIKNVLPDATHRLCGWHLQRNACENIKNPNFLRDFKGLIYDNNDHRDFDRRWAVILDKYNLVGSTWMEKTYETRAMWSHCFLRDKFFGYIRTMSQCEGINSLIRFYVNRKNTLIDFMHNPGYGLKEEIRNEIQRAGALNIKVLSTTLDKVEFNVTALGDPAKDQRVEVDRNLLIYKRWTKNAKNEFISTEMLVNDDIERVLKFRVGALASNCNKLCDIACKDLAEFDEVQSKLVNNGAPSKRSSWRKKRACSSCHKYGHYYKRCPDLMQHSVQGNFCDRSETNASAKDSGFSPERFANSSRSFSVKSEHHSGPKTKPFKKGGTRKFTTTGMRNRKGNDNTFDVRSLHESSESIDIASMNGFLNKNTYSLTQVKESKHDMGHSLTNYECYNDVIDEKCDTPHVQNDN